MGFTSGAKILADIIDEIAAGLIASTGGYWTNADTTWNTTVKTNNNARRALKYTNGSEVMYMTLEALNSINQNTYYSGQWRYTRGLRIGFAASWDSDTHVPGSTTYRTYIQFEGRYQYEVATDLATLQVTYYLWIDATGFVITGKPEPNATDDRQGSFFAVVERNANKEYSDGFSNFFCYCNCNFVNGTANGTPLYMSPFMRLFTYQNTDYNQEGSIPIDVAGMSFPLVSGYYAFKSNGNGKVYYIKPIICNSADRLTPIFQSELFFAYSEGQGLVDGDVIAIEGQTTKYLCKALNSPDSTSRLPYAIKYVA